MSDEKDPVVHSSLSKPLFISSIILVLVTGWALWDEIYGIRPWKSYQARFVKAYSKFLKGTEGGETALEDQIKNSAAKSKRSRKKSKRSSFRWRTATSKRRT